MCKAALLSRLLADAVDLLVQIGIRHETRRVVQIANISKELKGGDVWFDPVYRYNEQSPVGSPTWEKLGELQAHGIED